MEFYCSTEQKNKISIKTLNNRKKSLKTKILNISKLMFFFFKSIDSDVFESYLFFDFFCHVNTWKNDKLLHIKGKYSTSHLHHTDILHRWVVLMKNIYFSLVFYKRF